MLLSPLLCLLPAFSEKPIPSPAPEFDAFSDAVNLTSRGRDLSSVGCQNCCTQNDCRLAYMMTSPGVCCGAHPMTGMSNCCPFDASCVRCQSKWRCTRSQYITRSTKCSVCQGDMPPDCYRRQPTYHHSSGGSSYMFGFLVLLILFCAIGACMQRQHGDDVVVVQQGYPGGPPVQGQYAGQQVVYAQPGYGGGYGGGGVATGAAAGFVGGMLVGEALDHGGGYGGYGGGYEGGGYGGGGDFGGGDGGFSAD